MKSLDSFNFQNVSLIKVDVEGAERLVFLGAKATIRKFKPAIIFESTGEGDYYYYSLII